jgi:hypothetical protein
MPLLFSFLKAIVRRAKSNLNRILDSIWLAAPREGLLLRSDNPSALVVWRLRGRSPTVPCSGACIYKREIAGAYRSLPPGEILTSLPPGPCVASEKLDGETWFLHRECDVATLLSPTGKAITGVPVTDEANTVLGRWSGLLAGELYAVRANCRPRVFDLHAAMGGATLAQTDRLRFAVFDLLLDSETEMQRTPYPARVERMENLLRGGSRVHCARSWPDRFGSPRAAPLRLQGRTVGRGPSG